MNLVPLRKFKPIEQDLLYALCIRMRNEGSQNIKISFDEIKELCNYDRKDISVESFAKELESIYKKLLSITCSYTEGMKLKGFVLFTDYEIDILKQTADVSINTKFSYLLNDITKNFTRFEMLEFSSLSSSYSKTAYKFLKQYRRTGQVIFDMDTFKEQFCIPKNYRLCDIDARVLKPIKTELQAYFKKLKINKIKAKKGRKIEKIEFCFENEDDVKLDGYKTFRDEQGNYYQKHLYDFDDEEVKKTYPSVNFKKRLSI